MINELKDRKQSPYWHSDSIPPLEDDYSEESNPDSVCQDRIVKISNNLDGGCGEHDNGS